ncbi:Erg28-like protein [Hysterangium stoloniferum]|nr:Erg28-like protein [Hysterangium stoloniferum]
MDEKVPPMLPSAPGLLPKWQLFVSGMAFLNSAQNLYTLSLTRRIYTQAPQEVTGLQSRTFAIWTFTAAIIRIYCAYHINEKTIYDVAIWSYVAALAHFASEWLLFRSANFGAGLLGPLIVAPVSLFWMVNQYDFYIKI